VSPDFTFRSDGADVPAGTPAEIDDRITADEALKRVRKGEWLLYRGDFHNARQLLAAMGRRLNPGPKPASLLEAWKTERRLRGEQARTLGHVLVELDEQYRLALPRAPDVVQACEWAWGKPSGRTLTPLKTLNGVLGAAQWREKGLKVPGLEGTLEPHYGVYTPTRFDYLTLLDGLDVRGKTVFDLGTGTGVLGFVLLQRGAASAIGTDVEPAAIACARANAERLGLSNRFTAEERDGFPDGRAGLVVCNPPWIPETPRSRLDRAVYDEGGRWLERFLTGLPAHLEPEGRGALILSDLAERIGLRSKGWLEERVARAGLTVEKRSETQPQHPKSRDEEDLLFEARSEERIRLFVLHKSP
jgi:predicted RNA methylase